MTVRSAQGRRVIGPGRLARAALASAAAVVVLAGSGCCRIAALTCKDPQCGSTAGGGAKIELCPDCSHGTPVQPAQPAVARPLPQQHADRIAGVVLGGARLDPSVPKRPRGQPLKPAPPPAGGGTDMAPRSLGAAVTVGFVAGGLKGVIERLKETLRTASTEVQAAGHSLQQSAESVLAQLDYYLGQKLDHTFDRLNEQERRLAEDAESLIGQISSATEAIASSAADAAKRTAQEADIAAYDVANALPCKNKVPRLVYVTPETIEVNSQTAAPVIKVRGNFLNYGAPDIKVGGRPATLVAASANEYTIEIPNATISAIRDQTALKVSAVCNKCTVSPTASRIEGTGAEQSLAVTVRPIQTYALVVHITPTAELPVEGDWRFARYDHTEQRCNISGQPGDAIWRLPNPAWTYVSHELLDRDLNCKAAIVKEEVSPNSVHVQDQVTGCGCFLGFDCSSTDPTCFGRGWVRYTARIRYRTFSTSALPTFSATEASPRTTYTFSYDRPLPSGAQNVRWLYDATVNIRRGTQVETVTLSDANPNHGSTVQTRMVDGRLAVQINP